MRTTFSEWYPPTGDELRAVFLDATIILDANVLLSLYRTSTERRAEIMAVLTRVQDRLWVPYRAAAEYQRNRLAVVHQLSRTYSAIRDKFEHAAGEAKKTLVHERAHDDLRIDIERAIDKLVRRLDVRLNELRREHSLSLDDAMNIDPVRDELDALLDGRVGAEPDPPQIRARRDEAKKRFSERVPPGYLDADKTTGDPAGDYLLWAEVLDYASKSARPTLLITNDKKDDWFLSIGGRTIGPRAELIAEVGRMSPHRYHQLMLERFLQLAGEYLDTPVSDETIEEVTTQPNPFADAALAQRFITMPYVPTIDPTVFARFNEPSAIASLAAKANEVQLGPSALEWITKLNALDSTVFESVTKANQRLLDSSFLSFFSGHLRDVDSPIRDVPIDSPDANTRQADDPDEQPPNGSD